MRSRASTGLTVLVALAAVAGAVAFAAASPSYSSNDEAAHVDYAYQLWHGHLPVFEDGLVLRPGVGTSPPAQWVAQHPPLFYLLIAPVVGPLVDAGHPVAAALGARAVTVLLAALAAVAAVWAARMLAGGRVLLVGRRALLAAVAPVVLVGNIWFLRLGGAVYNDILLVLVVTLMLGLTAQVVRGRATRLTPLWLALTFAAGGLTRLGAIPLALLCLAVIAVAQLARCAGDRRRWALDVVLPGVAIVVASGWFYLRNLRVTGTFTGTQHAWAEAHLDRVDRTFGEVLRYRFFWEQSIRQFGYSDEIGRAVNALLFGLPLVVTAVLACVTVVRWRRPGPFLRQVQAHAADVLIAVLVVAAVLGVTVQQMLFVTTGGGSNGRYFAAVVLSFALLVAVALTRWPRATPWLLGVWLVLHVVDLLLDLRGILAVRWPEPSAHASPGVVWVAFVVHAAALAGAWALVRWRSAR